ncbi:hypothetical protein BH09BAC4_BH09BAC4_00640 [soil metagenome]
MSIRQLVGQLLMLIEFDLTVKNLRIWKQYLLTGEYIFNNDELKNKDING